MCRSKWILIGVVLSGIIGCTRPDRLERALTLAGENRQELEQVLEHYKDDPEKLRAAQFLIENMPGHYSYVGEEIERYYTQIDSVFSLSLSPQKQKELIDTISTQINRSKLKKVFDLCFLKTNFLIDHIDRAFDQWKNISWNDHLSFDDFCEYLLPYKNIEGEYPEQWHTALKSYYNGDLENLATCDQFRKSSFWACRVVNDAMPRRKVIKQNAFPILRMSTIIKASYTNSCDDHSILTQALMRSKGIPVATDYTPQWPRYGDGHVWNVVRSNSGKNFVFSGGEVSPGDYHKQNERRSKVFRFSYAINPELEELVLSGEKLPPSFPHLFLKDVSSEYSECADVVCPIRSHQKQNNQYAYLCLPHARTWKPVHWGRIEGDRALFTNMGKDCVYLPAVYFDGNLMPAGNPFHLTNQGERVEFIAHPQDTFTCTFRRKYPVFEKVYLVSSIYSNARIEASNRTDFMESDTLFVFRDRIFTTLAIDIPSDTKPYRYWRFITSDSAHYCNVAELLFYDKHNGKELTGGNPIGSEDSIKNSSYSKEVVFDHDGLTYFFSKQKESTWVGLDFEQPVEVGRIVFAPRSDDNNVWLGDTYELKYWGENGWISLGIKEASDFEITYSGIPRGALLLLTDLTRGEEERIFTVENGKQIWW